MDFADTEEFDWLSAHYGTDDSDAYDEDRFVAIGPFRGRLHVVVYALRDPRTRVISFRKAEKKEVRRYEKEKIDLSDYTDDPIDDPDSPELTVEMIRRMRPLRESPKMLKRMLDAPEELRARKRERGRPALEHPKVQVTLRLDEEIVNSFKEDGPGWQSRINETLKNTVKRRSPK